MIKRLKNVYHFLLSFVGAVLYRHPSKDIFVLGITGTKGKTTVIELINAGLEEADKKTAVISSIRVKIGDRDMSNTGNSMPGRFALQRFLRQAVKAGCRYAIVEVTSEGVVQHRHRQINFDAGVFINLHPEHIESHGSFEKYRKAKTDFFKYIANFELRNGSSVIPHSMRDQDGSPIKSGMTGLGSNKKYFFINKDDTHASYFIAAARDGNKIIFSKSELKSGLEGEFNKWNIGAAEAVLKELGVSGEDIKNAFNDFSGVPGRMEFIQREPFAVVVDYAHTPESLRQVYKTLRSANSKSETLNPKQTQNPKPKTQNPERKLICVLGSAGGGVKQSKLKIGSVGSRDKWKRPKFGEIAAEYCGEIILTNEDPWDEDPSQILSEIKSGISNSEFPISNVHEILDRKEAIKKAIGLAQLGDTVILTGKGSEKFIRVANGKKIPWSDKDVVKEILGEL